MSESPIEEDIEQLNSMLRGELSAVETYTQCIEKMDEAKFKQQLSTLQASHVARADKLTARIAKLGGKPETSSGAWGTFAKLVEGGAKLFGKSAALKALEEGEDRGKSTYTDIDDLSPASQAFVRAELLPEQVRTHDALNVLQEQV